MRRRFFAALAAVLAAFVMIPGAFGATPKDIARDLADGRLDGTYTAAELDAYYRDARVQGYEQPGQAAPPAGGVDGGGSDSAGVGTVGQADVLPFTGTDLGLFAVGGLLLLAIGIGLRRVGRQRA